MTRLWILCVLLFLSVFSFAQQLSLTVSGTIVDHAQAPLPFTNVRIFGVADSAFVNGNITDEDGTFSLEIPVGNYYLLIDYSGLDQVSVLIKNTEGTEDLGKIILKETATKLEEAVIVSQRDLMELKLDKRVYNVSEDLNNQGANATEVLENIPSVTVDAEGNVSLRGNQNVRILIDGKFSGFTSSADALRQLRAEMIEKVEIITNASARYDAEGDAGIINIILKKNSLAGLSGSVNVRVGYFPEYGGGFNLSYKKNKIQLHTSYNINKDESPATSTTYQRLNNADTSFAYRQLYEHLRKKLNNNASFGFDYDFNANNSLSAAFRIRSGLGDNFYDRVYQNLEQNDKVVATNTRYEDNTEFEDNIETSLSYRKKFKKEGSSWNTEFRWFRDQDFENSDYIETSTLNQDVLNQKSRAYVTENNYLFQSDLTIPFAEEGKIELGVRSQTRNMLNQFRFSQLVNDEWEAPANFNDNFLYKETVHAAYAMASNTFGRLGVQAGLRGEYSDIHTERANNTLPDARPPYFNLFPSAALSFKNTELQTFQLSYSRRIHRPGQWDLMPFTKFGDNREMRVGNAGLVPEFTHSLEGGMMQHFTAGSVLSSVYYRKTTDKIERMAIPDKDGIIYRIPMNIANRDAYGLELNVNYNPVKKLRVTSGFNFFREIVSGTFNNEDFEIRNFSWSNRTSLNVVLPQNIRTQLSANYQAPRINPQGRSLAIFHADFGMSKDVLNKNGTIGLNVRDIFNSRRWRNVTETEYLYSISDFQWRPRSIRLVFSYRFNQRNDAEKHYEERSEG